MPHCQSEEECRREKIIKNSQVAARAARDIERVQAGDYTVEQLQRLIEIDYEWLERRRAIVGEE